MAVLEVLVLPWEEAALISAIVLVCLGSILLLVFGAFGFTSLRENERRAALLSFGFAAALSLPLFLATLLPNQVQLAILAVLALGLVAAVVLLLLPVGRIQRGNDVPQKRVDERDIMFARSRLQPGTANYEAYYALRPEKQESDEKTRTLPGLLSPQSSAYEPAAFASTDASFGLTEALFDAVDGPVSGERLQYEASVMTDLVKGLTEYYGAHAVGITALHPYHIYSHIGRGDGQYGAPVHLDHRYAIAFTVEMDFNMVRAAPRAPTLMESARQYVEAAKVAVQLANFIRLLGYPARAHIDGNYRVIAPLVARDAGLGEIGRMGLLMTPKQGPRVRLGVVTTDLPLVPDPRTADTSMLDFCRICKKCANCCPPRAIPQDDRQEIDGALRWRIDDEICFRYWSAVGTDCARCMAVCPYSHPDGAMHDLIRWATRRSGIARRVVTWMDDLFYGAQPTSRTSPSWLPPRSAPG